MNVKTEQVGGISVVRVGETRLMYPILSDFSSAVSGLISAGYVLSDKVNLFKTEDVERANLRVNASYARDLRDALNPGRRRDEDRRRRRRG